MGVANLHKSVWTVLPENRTSSVGPVWHWGSLMNEWMEPIMLPHQNVRQNQHHCSHRSILERNLLDSRLIELSCITYLICGPDCYPLWLMFNFFSLILSWPKEGLSLRGKYPVLQDWLVRLRFWRATWQSGPLFPGIQAMLWPPSFLSTDLNTLWKQACCTEV